MSAIQSKTGSIRNFKQSSESKAQKMANSPLMETLTRVGYGARGLIYITMGLLAVQVALGKGGALASPQGAIAAIGKQPAGLVLLWVILVGIIAYALWGVVRAVFDPLDKGHDLKGLLARLGFLVSAFGYAILVWPTYGYITGASQTANGSQTQKLIATVMAMPWGRCSRICPICTRSGATGHAPPCPISPPTKKSWRWNRTCSSPAISIRSGGKRSSARN